MTREISCFISPHGFGHATRTLGVLEALHEQLPDLEARIFTTVPESLFRSCPFPVTYHRLVTDVGLVQDTAFHIDTEQTVQCLREFLPLSAETVQRCAGLCRASLLLLCDISPLGIAVGKQTGIPSLLLENFTWDWIYQPLTKRAPELTPFIDFFSACYAQADWRVQTEPVCRPAPAVLTCPPIARRCRLTRRESAALFDSNDRKTVLVSMGGIPFDPPFLSLLKQYPEVFFIIVGQPRDQRCSANVRFLSPYASLHHPDLINGADLLVCKCGYSTIAECAQTLTPLCCVTRSDFAESAVLAAYVVNRLDGTILDSEQFFNGSWLAHLSHLLTTPRTQRQENGSRQVAGWIASLLN